MKRTTALALGLIIPASLVALTVTGQRYLSGPVTQAKATAKAEPKQAAKAPRKKALKVHPDGVMDTDTGAPELAAQAVPEPSAVDTLMADSPLAHGWPKVEAPVAAQAQPEAPAPERRLYPFVTIIGGHPYVTMIPYWQQPAQAVPVPGTLALLLCGLSVTLFLRKAKGCGTIK